MVRVKHKKVVVVTNIPNPYRVPLFNSVYGLLKDKEVSLKIVFAAETYGYRKFQLDPDSFEFDYKVLDSGQIQLSDIRDVAFLYVGLIRTLIKEKPSHVVVSGFSTATFKVLLLSLFMGFRVVVWSGTVNPPSTTVGKLKLVWRRILAVGVDGFIAYGTKAKAYLQKCVGASSEKIQISFNTVDTSFFREETDRIASTLTNDNHRVELLTVTYLHPKKDVLSLLLVVKKLHELGNDLHLTILGDGDERENLEKFVSENTLQEIVTFEGFVQKNELPPYFSKADIFIFNTLTDVWGLVINEAMASRLPCIVSHNAGGAHDLIVEGETGYMVDFDNIDLVVEKANYLIEKPDARREMGQKARKHLLLMADIGISAENFIKGLGV